MALSHAPSVACPVGRWSFWPPLIATLALAVTLLLAAWAAWQWPQAQGWRAWAWPASSVLAAGLGLLAMRLAWLEAGGAGRQGQLCHADGRWYWQAPGQVDRPLRVQAVLDLGHALLVQAQPLGWCWLRERDLLAQAGADDWRVLRWALWAPTARD